MVHSNNYAIPAGYSARPQFDLLGESKITIREGFL